MSDVCLSETMLKTTIYLIFNFFQHELLLMKMVYHMLDKRVHVIFMMICIFSIKFFVEDSEVSDSTWIFGVFD